MQQSGDRKRRWWGAILLFILVLAALLRGVGLTESPPGLHQDEAANAWNAHCLLKTGKDQAGVSWPVFYTRGLGGHRATLHIYMLLLVQAVGGMSVLTTRLLGALGGTLAVGLLYFAGKRLFDRETGIVAAAFLTLNPWHLQQSRWGQDAALASLFGLLPLVMLLWARLPAADHAETGPRFLRAALAGAVIGLCCYGYHSLRIFIPLVLMGIVLVAPAEWWRCLKSGAGRWAVLAFFVTFGLTFGPLAWQHLADPEGIARHAQYQTSLFETQGMLGVAGRYVRHFGLDFLFVRGDPYSIQSPPDIGQFHWYMLPLMLIGLVTILTNLRSRSARVLLVCVAMYPAGDILYETEGMHALRSAPGLCGLVMLAALGGVRGGRWLWKRNRSVAAGALLAFGVAVFGLNASYLPRFYGEYNRREEIYHGHHADLVEAWRWLGPRMDDFDAVFCTTRDLNMPYIVSLVIRDHDPHTWFQEPRDFRTVGEWDYCTRYGKTFFVYGNSAEAVLDELRTNGRRDRIAFVVRPGEWGLKNPVYEIRRPDGIVSMWICEATL